MKKRTTTYQINKAISNNLLLVSKEEYYNKTTYQMSTLDNDTFTENLEFLVESGIFADCISWTYERNYKLNGEYIVEVGRMSDCNVIVTVHCRVNDSADDDEVERLLLVEEDMGNEL